MAATEVEMVKNVVKRFSTNLDNGDCDLIASSTSFAHPLGYLLLKYFQDLGLTQFWGQKRPAKIWQNLQRSDSEDEKYAASFLSDFASEMHFYFYWFNTLPSYLASGCRIGRLYLLGGSAPVWPDTKIKRSLIFTNVSINGAKVVFILKERFYK